MRRLAATLPLVVAVVAALLAYAQPATGNCMVVVGELKGVLTDASVSYIKWLLGYASNLHATLVVLKVSGPGGLYYSSLEAASLLESSSTPVVVLVEPPGAFSGYAVVSECASYLAMEPASSIGAATPVEVTPSGVRVVSSGKFVNPVADRIRSCMEAFGRNATAGVLMVTRGEVYSAEEAVRVKAANAIASSVAALLVQLSGGRLPVAAGSASTQLPRSLAECRVVYAPPGPGVAIWAVLSNPVVSSVLLELGMLLLLLGLLSARHHTVALIGLPLLVLGLAGSGLSVNATALLLAALGSILVAVGVASGSLHGLPVVVGVACLLLALLLLPTAPPTPMLVEAPSLAVLVATGAAVLAPLAGLAAVAAWKVARAQRRPPAVSSTPAWATAREDIPPGGTGWVEAEGELWRARNVGRCVARRGSKLRVVGAEGLTLLVEPTEC